MPSQHSSAESPCWQLEKQYATLRMDELHGQVDLNCPEQGIGQLVYQGNPLPGFLLGVVAEEEGHPTSLVLAREPYVRGSDLVICYDQTLHGQPYSLQIYWRAKSGEQGQPRIELIISLQTDLLENYPRLLASSRLESNPIDATSRPKKSAIFRLFDGKTSYLEMVATGDSVSQAVEPENKGTNQSRWPLGGDFLEKGVLRRMRIRGQFVPRGQDLELATALQAELESEQPPISI